MRWRRSVLVAAAACIGACVRDDGAPAGPELRSLRLEVVHWDSLQIVSVDKDIDPPAVRVVDDRGVPQQGVRVQYAVVERLPRAFRVVTDFTNAAGEWRVNWWAPNQLAARNEIVVYIAEGTSGGAQRFSVNSRAGAPVSLDIDLDSVRLVVGETAEVPGLTGVDIYGNAWHYVDELQFGVSDSSIAEVTADGHLRGVAEGRTVLTVTRESRRYPAWIVVGDPPAKQLVAANLITGTVTGMARDGGGRLYLVGESTTSQLWRFDADLAVQDSAAIPANDLRVAVTRDGHEVAVWSPALRRLWFLSGESLTVIDSLSFSSQPLDVQYSADGAYLLVADSGAFVRVNRMTGDWWSEALLPRGPRALAAHDSLPIAYVSDGTKVYLFDILTGSRRAVGFVRQPVLGFALDHRRNLLYAAPEGIALDASTLQERAHTAGPGPGVDVAVAPDGTRVYFAGYDRLRVYERSLVLPLEALSLSAAQKVIATSSAVLVLDGNGVLFKTTP